MLIHKCNGCKKILSQEDEYFSISEVDFHRGKAKKRFVRVYFPEAKSL